MSYNDQLRCDYLTTNHEGDTAWRMTPEWELYSTVATTMGVEEKFYENGDIRVRRIAKLVRKVQPEFVAQLAVYARETMHLRSVPLLLLVELARCHQGDSLVSRAVNMTVQRADEITELLMCYQWRMGKNDLKGLSNQLRKGLAEAFNHFDEYQFAKYDRKDRKVTLRDALLLAHPKPKDERQREIFKKILNDELETPYTWETELSRTGQKRYATAAEKKEAVRNAWQQLIASNRLGYMATMRNLRNLLKASIDDDSMEQVCRYLANPEAVKNSKQLPFRYLSAYLQLKEFEIKRPLEDEIKAIERKRQELEKAVAKRKSGIYPVRKRKVVRYGLRMTLGQCAKIQGPFNHSKPTLHFSQRVLEKRRVAHPSPRMLRQLLKLEKVFDNHQKQEAMLRRKQNLLEQKYGNPYLKMAKHLEKILQALGAQCQVVPFRLGRIRA